MKGLRGIHINRGRRKPKPGPPPGTIAVPFLEIDVPPGTDMTEENMTHIRNGDWCLFKPKALLRVLEPPRDTTIRKPQKRTPSDQRRYERRTVQARTVATEIQRRLAERTQPNDQ